MSGAGSGGRGLAVVTGASSGIGRATARRLQAEGWQVLAGARRRDRLDELAAESGCTAVNLDVTDDASVQALADVVAGHELPLTLLVDNAGGAVGTDRVEAGAIEAWRQMHEVNVLGTLRVTAALLPFLRRAPAEIGTGVVVVSSTAALVPYEGGGGYVAAKHAEGVLARTLRLELVGTRVRVTEIAPGMVATEEFSHNRLGSAEAAAKVYAGVDRPLLAQDVADCVAWAATRPPHVDVDLLVVRPVAQAAQHLVHREPLFGTAADQPDRGDQPDRAD